MTRVERLHERAKDAVATCLIRHLQVPAIYFEAHWPAPGGGVIDLLAIDRAGVGDVHVVEIKAGPFSPKNAVEQLMRVPSQFRWLAVFRSAGERVSAAKTAPSYLYPVAAMGRVGLIEVVKMADDSLGANILYRAERFRGNYTQEVETFTAANKPDIEFR